MTKTEQPTLADEDQERRETAAVLTKLKTASAEKQQKDVAQDLQIIIRKVELDFKQQDFERAHEVPFLNASSMVFGGLHSLLDEQTPADRRAGGRDPDSRVCRIEPALCLNYPDSEAARHWNKWRSRALSIRRGLEIETELGRNSNYIEGIATLLQKYNLKAGKNLRQVESAARPITMRGCGQRCCPRRALIFVCRRRNTRWTWKATASTFRPIRWPRWRIRPSPKFRRR